MDIVSALRQTLADRVGAERFDLWFGTSTRFVFDGSTLAISVPNQFFQEWLAANFRQQIESAAAAALGKPCRLEFRIDPSLPAYAAPASQPADRKEPAQNARRNGTGAHPGKSSAGTSDAGHRDGRSQRRYAGLESFVEGYSNRLARAAAGMMIGKPGELSPLLFHGPTSVGKTHLLEGIFTEARRMGRGSTSVYLSAEQFTSSFLEALRGGGLPNFRRKYRGVELLILDDVQFFVGKRATLVELLHTVDTLLRQGRQLVFAADRAPAEMPDLGDELRTRLEGGMVCRIEPPDYETRLGILSQMADRLGVNLPREVAQFVASRLTQHARQLSGALCRLQATSEAMQEPITVALAEEALAEMIRNSDRLVRLVDIERAVCEAFNLAANALQSDSKAKAVSHPRMLAMWLAKKYTRSALSEIGGHFGRRSHSTVLSAQKRVDGWRAAGKSLELADRAWGIDEAILRVERRLRAS
jgi:chromosomal replication initiator protein